MSLQATTRRAARGPTQRQKRHSLACRLARGNRAHHDRPLANWGISECGKICPRRKTELAGNPSEVNRAAKLREIRQSRMFSCGRPESPCVVRIQAARRETHCFGRSAVRTAASETRTAIGRRVSRAVSFDELSRLTIGRFRTGRSRRAAGMFGFLSARALLAPV
jgi:hypothetical protein